VGSGGGGMGGGGLISNGPPLYTVRTNNARVTRFPG
jgi:hypothetical protein